MFVITNIKLGDHQVSVPLGLSDLLKDAWVLKDKQDTNTSEGEYMRKIEMRNGRLYTVLITKSDESIRKKERK